MKVLIISDTHRNDVNLLRVLEKEKPVDLLVHCGDIEGSEKFIENTMECPVEMVVGNNDFFSSLPKEKEIMIGNYKVLLTHGHYYYVGNGNEMLKREAIARGMDIVMYGHTHKPVIEVEKDVIAINPGSLTYPRQDGKNPSYIIMTIDENGIADFQLRFVNEG